MIISSTFIISLVFSKCEKLRLGLAANIFISGFMQNLLLVKIVEEHIRFYIAIQGNVNLPSRKISLATVKVN